MNFSDLIRRTSSDSYSIEHIPASERRGRPAGLGAIWTVANVQLAAVTTGVIAVVLGLDLTWSIITVVVGNLLGALFMAYHSAQGPRLGLAQMVQSRAQFGIFGAWLPLAVVIILYFGFFVVGAVLTGEAIAALLHTSVTFGIWIGSIIAFMIACVGYDLIHRYDNVVTIFVVAIFVVITINVLNDLPSHLSSASPQWGTVLLMISIAVTWQLTWAPYVSDYSRYLPEDTSPRQTFLYTYLGSSLSSIWMMIVGILAATVASKAVGADPGKYIGSLFPAAHWIGYLGLAAPLIVIQSMSLYSGFLATVCTLFPSTRIPGTYITRIAANLAFAVVGTVVAVSVSGNFITNFTNFLLFLLYFIVPWTAINLTDYYIVRHGRYPLSDFFDASRSFGAFNWRALAVYVIALAVELPFADSTFYEGPIAKSLTGADIAWIVGLVVSAGLYLLWVAPQVRKKPDSGAVEVPASANTRGLLQ